jgi:hypothetical protein
MKGSIIDPQDSHYHIIKLLADNEKVVFIEPASRLVRGTQ